MKRVIFQIIGFILLFIGFSYLFNSISGITGFIILENTTKTTSSLVSMLFIAGGFTFLSLARRKRKGQAAMEFLVTYGWAILIAIVVIGVLVYFGIFSPGRLAGSRAMLSPPFYLNAWNAETMGITLELKNNGGENYNINKIGIDGCGEFNSVIAIGPGSTASIILPCDLAVGENFKGDITITYTKSGSSIQQASRGTIVEKVSGNINLIPNWLMGTDTSWVDSPEQILIMDFNGIESYAHDSAETTTTSCYNWARTALIPANPNKAYKFSIWIKSTDALMNNYFGFYIYDSASARIPPTWDNTNPWNNPYFKTSENDPNEWRKWEGYLGPSSAGAATNCDSSLTNGNDWCMSSDTVYIQMRFGSCYANGDANGHTYFMYPKIEEITWPQ